MRRSWQRRTWARASVIATAPFLPFIDGGHQCNSHASSGSRRANRSSGLRRRDARCRMLMWVSSCGGTHRPAIWAAEMQVALPPTRTARWIWSCAPGRQYQPRRTRTNRPVWMARAMPFGVQPAASRSRRCRVSSRRSRNTLTGSMGERCCPAPPSTGCSPGMWIARGGGGVVAPLPTQADRRPGDGVPCRHGAPRSRPGGLPELRKVTGNMWGGIALHRLVQRKYVLRGR